jgi:hypothetical protein
MADLRPLLKLSLEATRLRRDVIAGGWATTFGYIPRSPGMVRRAVFEDPGPWLFLDSERIYARNLENPSGNGVGTARAIARAYSVLATGGHELGLRLETLQALMAPAVPPLHGFHEVMKKEMCFSLGFLKPNRTYPLSR